MRRRCTATSTPRRGVEQRLAVERDAAVVRAHRPAIALSTLVLPEPERPNSAVTPPSLAKAASSANAPSALPTETSSFMRRARAAGRAAA